jgi:hypothetical protein
MILGKCPTCGRGQTRTSEQNRLAWDIVTAMAEQVQVGGKRFSKDVWWLQMKREFFGRELREMPDGTLVEVEPASHSRSVEKFTEWVEFLYMRAAELGAAVHE